MIIVEVRFKNGIKAKIKETGQKYYFFCPQQGIQIGDYVLVESREGVKSYHNDNFRVARIERIFKDEEDKIMKMLRVRRYVVCKLAVKDFEERCAVVRKMKKETNGRLWVWVQEQEAKEKEERKRKKREEAEKAKLDKEKEKPQKAKRKPKAVKK